MRDHSHQEVAARLQAAPSLMDMLRASAESRPNYPALSFYRQAGNDASETLTYSELLSQTEALARMLKDDGIGPDDGIAILLPTIPECVVAFIAASFVGVAFPINLLLSSSAMSHQMSLANVKAAIVLGSSSNEDLHSRFAAAKNELPNLRTVIEVDLATAGLPIKSDAATPIGPVEGHNNPDRIAALFHTGGTTGDPKLAQLSELNLAAGTFMSDGAIKWLETDRVMVCLPMFHVGGNLTCTMSTLAAGATVVFPSPMGARDPEVVSNIWEMIRKSQTSVLVMVPTSLSSILDVPMSTEKPKTLRSIATGATALSPDLGAALEAKTGLPVSQIYGMTETAGVCTVQPCDGQFRRHALGMSAPLLDMRIDPADSGSASRGEVAFRGPNCFRGYRTSSGVMSFPSDGWVHTGDIGTLGPDGQLNLLGRAKDTIIRSGHNIDPLLVEEAVQAHPAILQAAAVPMPDEYAGELPALYVSLRQGITLTRGELSEHIALHIAEPPARPKHIFFLDELPLTPVGKIAKFRLRQQAAIWRASEELFDLPISDVSCSDTAAKELSLKWHQAPSAETLAKATERLVKLGLRLLPDSD
jgi:fatty-acyl-CoA synthase